MRVAPLGTRASARNRVCDTDALGAADRRYMPRAKLKNDIKPAAHTWGRRRTELKSIVPSNFPPVSKLLEGQGHARKKGKLRELRASIAAVGRSVARKGGRQRHRRAKKPRRGKGGASEPELEMSKYVFDYNWLESVCIGSAIAVLLGGLIFHAADFEHGSAAHWSLTVFIIALIVSSVVVITSSLFYEIRRSCKYGSEVRGCARPLRRRHGPPAVVKAGGTLGAA